MPRGGDDLCDATAVTLAAWIARGELSAREVVAAHLARIEAVNPSLNAIVTLTGDRAMASWIGAAGLRMAAAGRYSVGTAGDAADAAEAATATRKRAAGLATSMTPMSSAHLKGRLRLQVRSTGK